MGAKASRARQHEDVFTDYRQSDEHGMFQDIPLVADEGSRPLLASIATHSNRSSSVHSASKRKRYGSTLWGVTGFIIVTEFCERLAYYGFAGSLVLLFQEKLHMTNGQADTQYALWSGVCYVTPLLGGWVADTYLGRYKAILLFSALYVLGLALITAGSGPGEFSAGTVFPAMYIIAVATGGIKPNVSTFGADQFDDDDPADQKEKDSFFNWFYWSINLGALFSYTLVSYVSEYGLPFLGGKPWGFFVGYAIPTVAMALAVAVFVAGSKRYTRLPPQGSVLGSSFKIVKQAAGARLKGRPHGKSWLDGAKRSNGGTHSDAEVEGVWLVWRMVPFLVLQVPYWVVYSQLSTGFQNQGCQMNLKAGGLEVPVAGLNMFDTLAILLLIPVFDKGIYPWLKAQGRLPTMLQKIGAGFVFAALAVVAGGVLEVARRGYIPEPEGPWPQGAEHISHCRTKSDYEPAQFQTYWANGRQAEDRPAYCSRVRGCSRLLPDTGLLDPACIVCEDIPQASTLSIFWQVPQFLLIGTSEILTSVTTLEFFYSQAPESMRSISAALNLLTTALGSWLTIPIIKLVNLDKTNMWVPDDLNRGHIEYYFFLLAAMMVVTLGVWVWVAQGYTYRLQHAPGAEFSAVFNHMEPTDNGDAAALEAATAALGPKEQLLAADLHAHE